MGQYDTHGGYFAPQGYTRINTGGSHEENPNGGVQLGVDAQGIPNMLEEGEPVYNDFVYSDNIKANAEILKKHGIPTKFAGKLYSVIADYYVEEANKRPLDSISNNGLNAMLTRLAEAQEEQKQLEAQKELEEQISQMSPEEQEQLLAMIEQQNAQGQMPEGVPPEAEIQGMPQDGQAMMSPEQQMSPEEAMMMQQQAQAPAPQMMPQQPVMMANGGLIRRFDMGSPQGNLVTHRLAGTDDLNRFYNPQSYSLSVDDTVQEQAPEVETIMATKAPVYFNPDDNGTTRGGYMAVNDNGELIDDIAPAVVTAFPDKSQAWVDAEVGPRSIKKTVAEGRDQALADAYDFYRNQWWADPFSSSYNDIQNGDYESAAMNLGFMFVPWERAFRPLRGVARGIGRRVGNAINKVAGNIGGRVATARLAATEAAGTARAAANASADAVTALARKVETLGGRYEDLLARSIEKPGSVLEADLKAATDAYKSLVSKLSAAERQNIVKQLSGKSKSLLARTLGSSSDDLARATSNAVDQSVSAASRATHPTSTFRSKMPEFSPSPDQTLGGNLPSIGGNMPDIYRGDFMQRGLIPTPAGAGLTKGQKWAIGIGTGIGVGAAAGGIALSNARKNPLDNPYKYDPSVYNLDYDNSVHRDQNNHALGGQINRFAPGGALTTLPRYAGVANNAIATLYNAAQKPDHYEIPQYNPILPTMSAPEYTVPVYRPDDVNMLTNQYLADAAGNRRALINSGAGPSTAANLAALNYGTGNNIGTMRERVLSANNTQRNNVIQQRNVLAKDRATMDNTFAQARAQIYNPAILQNIQNSLLQQQLNNQAESQKYAALQSNMNAMSKDLAGIGKENWNMNMINQNPYFQYGIGSDGNIFYNPNYTIAQQPTQPTETPQTTQPADTHSTAYGGFIRRIKR